MRARVHLPRDQKHSALGKSRLSASCPARRLRPDQAILCKGRCRHRCGAEASAGVPRRAALTDHWRAQDRTRCNSGRVWEHQGHARVAFKSCAASPPERECVHDPSETCAVHKQQRVKRRWQPPASSLSRMRSGRAHGCRPLGRSERPEGRGVVWAT